MFRLLIALRFCGAEGEERPVSGWNRVFWLVHISRICKLREIICKVPEKYFQVVSKWESAGLPYCGGAIRTEFARHDLTAGQAIGCRLLSRQISTAVR